MRRIKILWNFEIQTDHLIQARRPYQVLINKKIDNLSSREFCRFVASQSENEKKKWKEKWELGPLQRTKIPVEHANDSTTNCRGVLERGLEISGKINTIQTTALFISAQILKRVLET